MKGYLLAAAAVLAAGPAISQDLTSMIKAQELGSILGSEEACGFSFDQAAIRAWIDANTDPADMGFASSLTMMTDGAALNLSGQSQSTLTAHCRAVERTARHFGFLK